MRKIILLSMFLSYGFMQAQDSGIGVGIGTLLPDASAALHVSSTDKGVLLPTIALSTRADKASISGANPKLGLMIFNTTNDEKEGLTPGFYVWAEDKTIDTGDKYRWVHLVTSGEIKQYISENTSTYSLEVTPKDATNSTTQVATLKDAGGAPRGAFTETLTNITKESAPDSTVEEPYNNNISYVYVDESGASTTLNLTSDVINSFGQIVNDTEVKNILKEIIKNSAGSVNITKTGEDYVFTYTDDTNQTQTFHLTTEIRAKQIYTSVSPVDPTTTTGSGLSIDSGKIGETPFSFTETVTYFQRIKDQEERPVIYKYFDETGNSVEPSISPMEDILEDIDIFFANSTVINKIKDISTGSLVSGWNNVETKAPATAIDQAVYNTAKAIIGSETEKTHAQSSNIKLQVDGDVLISGKIITSASIYADYVFEKYFEGHSSLNDKYVFNDLEYVEEFVKAYNHLPGVTSISELSRSEDGGYYVDFNKLAIEQLEKIEELYLHTIDQ